MRLLRDLWATSPFRVASVICLIVLGGCGQATAPALSGAVLVHRSSGQFAALAVALVVAVTSDLAVALITSGLTANWATDVRGRLCRVTFGQGLPALETTPVGETLDRIDADVQQVASELRGTWVRLAQSLTLAVLSAVAASFVWWPAGLVMLGLAMLLAVTVRGQARRITPARMAQEEAWSDLTAVMEEAIHGQDDVRTSLAQPFVLRQYARRASRVLASGRQVWRLAARVSAVSVGVVRAGIAVVVLGGVAALVTGHIDGARLTSVWLLALAFGGIVEQLSRTVPQLERALGAWGRVELLRMAEQEPTGGVAPTDGDLTIRGLTFRYPSGSGPALRDVSLTFLRGRSYALIGRTGAGKSTVAKVLTRTVEVPRGRVYLGRTDLVALDVDALRQWICTVPQRTDILAGTLAENVTLFDERLVERVTGALRELGLAAWVDELPDGIHTRLGDGGHVLSAGQEQLVAFARLLVRDPPVVILDEATARIDPVTEARVQQATERLLRNRIGIVIAHRLSSVRRCDEVVVLADGEVVETGPLGESQRYAQLLSASRQVTSERPPVTRHEDNAVVLTVPSRAEPPRVPEPPAARTLREVLRLTTNDPRYGIGGVVLFLGLVLLGLDGAVLARLWVDLSDGLGEPLWPTVGVIVVLLVATPLSYYAGAWYPEWWTRQTLRVSLHLVHGQTGPRRIGRHTPADVVAHANDSERAVYLADSVLDHAVAVVTMVVITVAAGSFVPALFFGGTMVVAGLAAALFSPVLARSAQQTVAARAAFATALASSLSAARTVKLAGATLPVIAHLARLESVRGDRLRRETLAQVWAGSITSVVSGLLPIAVWAAYLSGSLSSAATLVAVVTLGSARWFAATTASLLAQLHSARVWTRRTVAMTGVSAYSAPVPGVDLAAGTAPAPLVAPRQPLRHLELAGFGVVHDDGTVGVRDVDLTVNRGELVLVVGPVGAGKSSLLGALAGITRHKGMLCWNGEPVTDPELFLRPNQVGYVAQQPRVLSGTVADNIGLGHDVDVAGAVSTARLDHDLAVAGDGLALLVGHKGTRLSGGQLQRLALARALAPRTELLIVDDVSSALDLTTELELWRALRERGVTVVGSTSKRVALAQADVVVVLTGGVAVAVGSWPELADRWDHLAG